MNDRTTPKHHILFALVLEKVFHYKKLKIPNNDNINYKQLINEHQFFDIEIDEDIPKYPDTECIDILYTNLNKALKELNGAMWDTHDHFYVIDEQIEKDIADSLQIYSDFMENPLIKQNTKNFRDLIAKLLALIRTTNFCRRKLQSMQSTLLPDFAMAEINSTDKLLESFIEWSKYIYEYPAFTKEEWMELSTEFTKYENGQKHRMGDMMNICSSCIDNVKRDGDEFINDELPEIERLINAQIMIKDEIIIYDLFKVVHDGAFTPLIPTKIPTKISDAIDKHRNKLYQRKEIDIEHEMGVYLEKIAHKIPGYCVLLNQGLIFVFQDVSMNDVLLSIQITMIQNIHITKKDIQLVYNDQSIQFALQNKHHFKEWKKHLETFCV